MTRGRQANDAYVITEDNQATIDVLNQSISREWIDRPAISIQPPTEQGSNRDDELRERYEMERAIRRARIRIEERRTIDRQAPRPGLSL